MRIHLFLKKYRKLCIEKIQKIPSFFMNLKWFFVSFYQEIFVYLMAYDNKLVHLKKIRKISEKFLG
jgi:hypothetical protein